MEREAAETVGREMKKKAKEGWREAEGVKTARERGRY